MTARFLRSDRSLGRTNNWCRWRSASPGAACRLPPIEDVRVNALIDDPLLTRMVQAKVACLRPGCKMPDLIVRLTKSVQALRLQQVALFRTQTNHLVPIRFQGLVRDCVRDSRLLQ